MKQRFRKYQDMPNATTSKKIAAFVIDFLLITLVGILLTGFISFPILKSNDSFKQSSDSLYNKVSELYDIQVDAKLSKKVEGEKTRLVSSIDLFKDYFAYQIGLSYSKDPTKFNESNISVDESKVATYENDSLAYYFVHYKVEKNINLETFGAYNPKSYFIEKVLKETPAKELYIYDGDSLPYLRPETCIDVYKYLHDETFNGNSDVQNVINSFSQINKLALNDLQSYDHFESLYQEYVSYFNKVCNAENLALFICFIVAFLLVFLLPQIILGNGFTIARFILKIRLDYENKLTSQIIANLISFVLLITSLFVINMFTFGFTTLTASIGAFKPMYLIIFALFMLFIDLGFLCFNREKLSMVEFFSQSRIVGIHYYIEDKINE